jgi:hypothetical protein
MNTIIALRGVANRGKTASIKRVYDLLKGAYSKAMFQEIVVGVDIQIIITIDGVKVGIESQGDPNSRQLKSLKTFVKVGCKVIVCATRSYGMTVDAVNSLSKQYNIQWLEKQATQTKRAQDVANDEMATQIFHAVQVALVA